MTLHRTIALLGLLLGSLPVAGRGDDVLLHGQDAVPVPFQDSRYKETFAKNPFLTKERPPPRPAKSAFSDDWELGSVVEQNGVIKAGLRSKKEPDRWKYITTEVDSEGYSLVSADIRKDRSKTSVNVAKGSERASFTFGAITAPGAVNHGAGGVPKPSPLTKGGIKTGPSGATHQSVVPNKVPNPPINMGKPPIRRRSLVPAPVP